MNKATVEKNFAHNYGNYFNLLLLNLRDRASAATLCGIINGANYADYLGRLEREAVRIRRKLKCNCVSIDRRVQKVYSMYAHKSDLNRVRSRLFALVSRTIRNRTIHGRQKIMRPIQITVIPHMDDSAVKRARSPSIDRR